MAGFLSRDHVIAHPFLSGWLWAVLAIPLIALALYAMDIRVFEWRQVPKLLGLILVAGPLFGLLLRWAYERDDSNAR